MHPQRFLHCLGIHEPLEHRQGERVGLRRIAANGDELSHPPSASIASDMHDEVNRQGDRLSDAGVREADVRRGNATGEPCERLFGRVRVQSAQAAKVASVRRLEEIERFRAAHLADEDSVGLIVLMVPGHGVGDRQEH